MKTATNGLVDYFRLAAALGIVWFNSGAPGARLAYAALPFFLVLISLPSTLSVAAQARRLIVPFLVWSALYALVQIAFAVKRHEGAFDWWEWNMLLTGTWLHLWLLPFAFVASVLSPWFRHPLATLGAALLLASLLAMNGTPDGPPVVQWSFGIIPVLVGIAFFSWGWRLAVTTLLASWLILYFGRPSEDNATILAGTLLALLILSQHLPQTALSVWCARLSMLVYLAHPLVIIVGQSLRITWVELGLFSVAASLILAVVLDWITKSPRDRAVFI